MLYNIKRTRRWFGTGPFAAHGEWICEGTWDSWVGGVFWDGGMLQSIAASVLNASARPAKRPFWRPWP
jgi:hypothetical protein